VKLEKHSDLFPLLDRFGLPHSETHLVRLSAETIIKAIQELDKVRHDFRYQTDGAVVKVDSLAQRQRLGSLPSRRAGPSLSSMRPNACKQDCTTFWVQVGANRGAHSGGGARSSSR